MYKLLEHKTPEKITIMIEAVVGMLRNVRETNAQDVELYLKKYESFMYKLQKTDAGNISDEVADKHFEVLKHISKCFTDKTNENFRECAPYTPFLAWGT